MDYTDLQQSLAILTARAAAQNGYVLPANFVAILPRAIEYAEDRIYREMTFLATRAQDSSLTFSGNTRSLNLSAASAVIIVPEGLSAIYPVGKVPPEGTQYPFTNTSLDVIDIIWPTQQTAVDVSTYGGELYWAMQDDHTMVVAPTPSQALAALVTGLFMPARISATNPTTYISLSYPDLMEAASMIFMAGYLRNFGSQADDPKMAQSWENQYGILKASAFAQEQRLRGQGAGWSQNLPAPLAKPERT